MSAEAKMNEPISCLITPTELAQIDQLIARTGQTRSEWLQSLVKSALSETPRNIRHLTERVTRIEHKLADLTALQNQVQYLTQIIDTPPKDSSAKDASANNIHAPSRTEALPSEPDQRVSPLQSLPNSSAPDPTSVNPSARSIYDEVDDDPYEILHEFLEPESTGSDNPQKASQTQKTPSQKSIYDVEDDDPDEILYDFMEDSDRPF